MFPSIEHPSVSADFDEGVAAYQMGDYEPALDEFYSLSDQGHASAQFNLGVMYKGGVSVPQSDDMAVKYYTLAAKQGDTDAQYYLGVIYRRGVLQDFVYAHMWWDIAASAGDKMAAKNRDVLAKKMSISQIGKAQNLASQCLKKRYKDC